MRTLLYNGSTIGADCVVRAGAVVKQRSHYSNGVEIDGFPAAEIGRVEAQQRPPWALTPNELPTVIDATVRTDSKTREPRSQ
jgi:carbonic anhydrase/acetyltransferase-like protein (isoleucine patch superfamily)